jgi:superfamily II DNA/RNA helicase
LHADMTAKQREESVRRLRKGEIWIMVSTEVMARGMDFGGIKGVLNYDFPQSVQSYIHRIGKLASHLYASHGKLTPLQDERVVPTKLEKL